MLLSSGFLGNRMQPCLGFASETAPESQVQQPRQARSHQISEAYQGQPWLVLEWETTKEVTRQALKTLLGGVTISQLDGTLYTGRQFSSIPLTLQTSVISNTEKKGFNSQSKRFLFNPNENPGPGFYNITHQSALLNHVSQSRKGTCFFPSLDVRIARLRVPNYPAANAYSLPRTLQSKQDFSLGYSSMFQQPMAGKLPKAVTPAPNQYNVSLNACKKGQNIGAKSAFISKTRRELPVNNKQRVPSPCHYQIKDTFVRQSPAVLVSSFKSRTTRETKMETLSPGPAAYQRPSSPITVLKKSVSVRKHTLNFSAPPVPRPKSPPPPGPGQYELVDYEGPSKHYISSAVFVSNTDRCFRNKYHQEIPGPGAYDLPTPQKQSFIYNTNNKWVPVL